jgi:hypothetical protein
MIRDHIRIVREIARGIVKTVPNARYLELGIFKGRCFNRVAPMFQGRAVGVDANDRSMYIKAPGIFWHCTTDEYFESKHNGQKFDLIFIDACHQFDPYVKRDFCNSYEALNDNGIILMHDTYPPSKRHLKGCGDAWKISDWLKGEHTHSGEFMTLPFYYGLTVYRKGRKLIPQWILR